jgi:hypothetical protein
MDKVFQDKQKIKQFMSINPELQKKLKGSLLRRGREKVTNLSWQEKVNFIRIEEQIRKRKNFKYAQLLTCVYIIFVTSLWADPVSPSCSPNLLKKKHKR